MLSQPSRGWQRAIRARLHQLFAERTDTTKLLPRWRHPLAGYCVGLLFAGLGLGVGLAEARLLFPFSFPGVLLLFAVAIVALLWRAMPALFTVVLSLFVLDYLYVPPFGGLGAQGWSGTLQLFTFAGAGAIIAILVHQREAARIKALQNELALREANSHMEEFIGIICHELKTPLTIMRGNLQLADRKMQRLMATEVLSPDELSHLLQVQDLTNRAQNQIAVQDRLVNDLLDTSRVQAQALNLVVAPCNLVQVIQVAVEDQRQVAPTRVLHLCLPEQDEVVVHADADRLAQVLTNYVSNALKYSPSDLPVDVNLSVKGSMVQVSVRDEGPGIPLQEQESLWKRFYRVPGIEVQSGSASSNVGLGVGLYLCRTIIEQHGGKVGVQSLSGKGSTFWFTLPLVPTD